MLESPMLFSDFSNVAPGVYIILIAFVGACNLSFLCQMGLKGIQCLEQTEARLQDNGTACVCGFIVM